MHLARERVMSLRIKRVVVQYDLPAIHHLKFPYCYARNELHPATPYDHVASIREIRHPLPAVKVHIHTADRASRKELISELLTNYELERLGITARRPRHGRGFLALSVGAVESCCHFGGVLGRGGVLHVSRHAFAIGGEAHYTKAFLSSTYVDLADYRKATTEALERLGHQVERMEIFGARPEEPKEACLAEIEACDLFVGLYAHRYGHVPAGSDSSI